METYKHYYHYEDNDKDEEDEDDEEVRPGLKYKTKSKLQSKPDYYQTLIQTFSKL